MMGVCVRQGTYVSASPCGFGQFRQTESEYFQGCGGAISNLLRAKNTTGRSGYRNLVESTRNVTTVTSEDTALIDAQTTCHVDAKRLSSARNATSPRQRGTHDAVTSPVSVYSSALPIKMYLYSPNSTWLVTSRLDTTRYLAHAFRHREKA